MLLFVGLLQVLSGKIALSAGLFDVLLNGADFTPVSDGENLLAHFSVGDGEAQVVTNFSFGMPTTPVTLAVVTSGYFWL